MTSNLPAKIHLTSRDVDLLGALLRTPLTVEQLRKVSETFQVPFPSQRRVRRRLQALIATGHAQRFRYATASEGSSPCYYKLSLAGYRTLCGDDAQPPTKGFFHEVAVGHHHHTRSLADFIVHTIVAARRQSVRLTDFCGENTVKLDLGSESLLPDCCFRLVDQNEQALNFLVELDNSTERVRTKKDVDNWQRKIRLYEAHQDRCQSRFRVLVLSTRSHERIDHILEVAAEEAKNQSRLLIYGAYLPDYLAHADVLGRPCFRDHHRESAALVPSLRTTPIDLAATVLPPTMTTISHLRPIPVVR